MLIWDRPAVKLFCVPKIDCDRPSLPLGDEEAEPLLDIIRATRWFWSY